MSANLALTGGAIMAEPVARLLTTHLGSYGAKALEGVGHVSSVEAHVARSTENANSLDTPFQQVITWLAWGEQWSNNDLTRRERRMITTGILAAPAPEDCPADRPQRGGAASGADARGHLCRRAGGQSRLCPGQGTGLGKWRIIGMRDMDCRWG
ncbi:hypothetical protein [Halomonas litopenaei]|uniref:hypothetical protein n=1 Tax=Halomonas litopenaei TaxID=2109328 RepID=UPI003FA011DE